MYVYIGNDVSILKKEIVGVFDIEKVTVEKNVNQFLAAHQKQGKIYYASLDMPKSFVVCKDIIYICGVSAATILKRAND